MSYMPHIVASPNEFRLPHPGHVQTSRVQFSKEHNSRLLAVSGWDGAVRIYYVGSVGHVEERRSYYHTKATLTCTFATSARVASGGLDNQVWLVDVETGKEDIIGNHGSAVRCMEYNPVGNVVVSGGWDATIKLWDASGASRGALQSAIVSEKVYAMDVYNDYIVVGSRDRKIYLFDMRNMSVPVQSRESPLKYQTRAIAFHPDGKSFVVSSIEGRIAVEYVDMTADEQAKKYAFKAHRVKKDGMELIYPVNAIAFHPYHGTFATGGSDKIVNIWDPVNRKRLVQYANYHTSVASASFNFDGTQLAIANSYQGEYEVDPKPLPEHTITIRTVTDVESRPKGA